MFIYISDYKPYFGPYQLADQLKYLCVHEFHREKIAEFLSKTKLNDFCEKIYEKINRLSIIKISSSDVFSFDSTLAPIILKGLKLLKEKSFGAPFVPDEYVPHEIKASNAKPKANDYDVDEFWFDRWDYVLNKMIWSFKHYDDYFYESEMDCDYQEFLKEHQECIDEGLKLFGIFYKHLWY